MRWLILLFSFSALAGGLLALQSPSNSPPFEVDDEQLLQVFTEKLSKLVDEEKCLPFEKLRDQVKADRRSKVAILRATDKRFDPEEVYESALESVFIVGSVVDDEVEYQSGRMATGWVLHENGILVTNYHVFVDLEEGEYFGVIDRQERVYPIEKILAVDQVADLCVFQIPAKKLKPLPLATTPVRVGAWVGVLGHPGDHFYSFTQGHVTRHSMQHREDGHVERWLGITADFAIGASGSPVLDRRGAVVGIAALTKGIEAPADKNAADTGVPLQMVVKEAVPVSALLKLVEAQK